ncbi:MAG TPA: hypothetical protein VNJ04_13920 [Gemmatimonadaceae bacterium]|nr:hypothetical protein [Gemmatimonadaceae bacterium]
MPLNNESWFDSSTPVFVELLLMLGLPPNAIVLSPVVPLSNTDLMRTVPLDISRYGFE